MSPAERPVARIFADYQGAVGAIRALEAAQIEPTCISVVARSQAQAEHLEHDTGASEDLENATEHRHLLGDLVDWLGRVGSVTVPGLGPVLGTGNLWQDVALGDTARGTITGTLVGLGVPIDEAAAYEDAVDGGQILVIVHGAANQAAAQAALTLPAA